MPFLPQPEDLEAPKTHHFKVKTFKKVKPCGICRQVITREGCTCKGEPLVGPGLGDGTGLHGSEVAWGQVRLGLGFADFLGGPDLVPGSHLGGDGERAGWQACGCVWLAHGRRGVAWKWHVACAGVTSRT